MSRLIIPVSIASLAAARTACGRRIACGPVFIAKDGGKDGAGPP
jgi:hypothetical protein